MSINLSAFKIEQTKKTPLVLLYVTFVFMKLSKFYNCNVIYILRRNVTSRRKLKNLYILVF